MHSFECVLLFLNIVLCINVTFLCSSVCKEILLFLASLRSNSSELFIHQDLDDYYLLFMWQGLRGDRFVNMIL